MKSLHDLSEQSWQFQAPATMTGVLREGKNPKQCFLLLHGLTERGRRVYRKLLNALPSDDLVIAPNGPFPMPRMKENKLDMGYAWYVYDRFENKYVIGKEVAVNWLKEVLKQSNPLNLPVTIIGFSQGGYLAPQVAAAIPQTKLAIGIGCVFRASFIDKKIDYKLEAIHGMRDPVVEHAGAKAEVEILNSRGINCGWHEIESASHEINSDVVQKVRELINQNGT